MGRKSKADRDFRVACSLHGTSNVSGNYTVESCLRCNSEGTQGEIRILELKDKRYFIVECSLHGITKASDNRKIDSCQHCTDESIASKAAIQILELSKEEWGNWDKYDATVESLR